jgi:hypothetical protein
VAGELVAGLGGVLCVVFVAFAQNSPLANEVDKS